MVGDYKVITLCGSTRFKEEFIEVQKRLTLEGNIVISVGLFGHSGDDEVWEGMDEGTLTDTKEMLDDMHLRKIDMADEIFVINVDGYIGESTEAEIEYAEMSGKEVRYLVDPEEPDDFNILEEIIDLLYEEEGLKAKEIARRLGISRKEVNHYLYLEEDETFYHDALYRWYIVDPDEEYEDEDEEADDAFEEEEIDPEIIEANDFLVRTSLQSCIYREHDIEDITASVKVMNGKGEVDTVLIPAFYCSSCEQFYILEPDFRKLKVRGTPICKVVDIETYEGIKTGKIELNDESLLFSLGYNVNAKEGLPSIYRQRLLRTILKEKVMTKAAILSHLDYLIRRSSGTDRLDEARSKWEDDRRYVSRLNLNMDDSVSVETIKRKK